MRIRWPVRRIILAVGVLLALASFAAWIWAAGRTDSGLYCPPAYPGVDDAACSVFDDAGRAFLAALIVCVLAGVAELVARVRLAKT